MLIRKLDVIPAECVKHLVSAPELREVNWTLMGEIALGLSLIGLVLAIWSDQRYSRSLLLPKLSEKPMFVVLRVPPCMDVESVRFSTRDGKLLEGVYARHLGAFRRGVVVFCHEYLADPNASPYNKLLVQTALTGARLSSQKVEGYMKGPDEYEIFLGLK